MGLSQADVRAAFGHLWIPAAIGRVAPIDQRDLYDVAGLLDLPPRGRPTDPAVVRAALGPYLTRDAEPRPEWIAADEPWP
jgi:hypothetical protein